jgi:hypothetical protein
MLIASLLAVLAPFVGVLLASLLCGWAMRWGRSFEADVSPFRFKIRCRGRDDEP